MLQLVPRMNLQSGLINYNVSLPFNVLGRSHPIRRLQECLIYCRFVSVQHPCATAISSSFWLFLWLFWYVCQVVVTLLTWRRPAAKLLFWRGIFSCFHSTVWKVQVVTREKSLLAGHNSRKSRPASLTEMCKSVSMTLFRCTSRSICLKKYLIRPQKPFSDI